MFAYSHFSLMWGTASPAEICRTARKNGFTRLALVDRDNLYGLWPFLKACKLAGLIPIVGAEVSDPKTRKTVVVLVENEEGYKNLCRLISRRHLDADFEVSAAIATHAQGLWFLTDDEGLLRVLRDFGVALAAALPCLVPGRDSRTQKIARELGIPVVAMPESVFLDPHDYDLHRLLQAIEGNTSLHKLNPEKLASPKAYMARQDEYSQRFELYPEAVAAAERLAERLQFTGPAFGTVLPPLPNASPIPAGEALRQAACLGARKRYGEDLPGVVAARLEKELGIIEEKQFSSYFLVVQDIIRRSPRICGRGSGAASLVAYSLGITNVCPIKHNLYFERFLNSGRLDPPDIDVDFAWDERDDVIHSVLEQYPGHSAMVCNHVSFQPRMAIREVAKVYGLTDREIGQVSKRLPWLWHGDAPGQDFQSRLESLPELKRLDFPNPWPEILALAQKVMGAPRYISVHPGGIVITPRPVDEYAPIERAPKGVPILQWEKEGTEDSGLVKIDLLGNRSLGVIRDAIANIRANNIEFDEWHWEPEEDPATQKIVAQGQTMGCFYIESPAMRQLQQKTGMGDFNHLVIHSSIIRPAANDYIREYIRRLKGGTWEPIHPLLGDVLDETFGIMVYQEDVSKTAVALAGFSHVEAEGLRKILTKKDRELRLRDYQTRFFTGAQARGLSLEQIQKIWSMMMSFDGYSFCKPHSASYARVSFQAAYLKVHFPAEFMAAVLSNQGGFYSAFAYVSEARRLGLTVLNPDVNESDIRWKGDQNRIQVGLLAIQSLSQNTQERIVAERRKRPFMHFDEFLDRVDPDQEEGRTLVHSGACDRLAPGQDRTVFLWKLAARHLQRSKIQPGSQSLELFSTAQESTLPPIPDGKEIDRLRLEYQVLGSLCDRHPMVIFNHFLPKRGLVKACDLGKHIGRRVRVAGWLITGKVVPTKKDEPMEFITFEDETGVMETTFFPKVYHQFCDRLVWNRPYILSGMVDEDFGAVTLTVDWAKPLKNLNI